MSFSFCELRDLFFIFRVFFFPAFLGLHCGIWKFPAQGSNQSCSYGPTPQPQPQPCQVRTTSATYTSAHGNTGSLTQGRGSNPHPHGYQLGLLPLSYSRSSLRDAFFKAINIFKKAPDSPLGLALFSIEKTCGIFPCPRVPPNGHFMYCSPEMRRWQVWVCFSFSQPSENPQSCHRLYDALCCPVSKWFSPCSQVTESAVT